MRSRRKSRKKNRKILSLCIALALTGIMMAGGIVYGIWLWMKEDAKVKPEELLAIYMDHISGQEYEAMYEMLDLEASGGISKEDFITRNSAIYEGIEAKNLSVEILSYDKDKMKVNYQTSFDTAAGEISFENEAFFSESEEGYRLIWNNALIFPGLTKPDKVRVSVVQAKRGIIYDRNDHVLAV